MIPVLEILLTVGYTPEHGLRRYEQLHLALILNTVLLRRIHPHLSVGKKNPVVEENVFVGQIVQGS
jgi:hypothetical protein